MFGEKRLVAYSGAFTEGVGEVVSQWRKVYVGERWKGTHYVSVSLAYSFVSFPAGVYLTIALQVSCLEEQPTSVKFDMLDRKSLYILVRNMAILQRLDESRVVDIHRQYGDHLYTNGDYDGAMTHFVKTIAIGYTQHSPVP